MRISIDTDARTLSMEGSDGPRDIPLYSDEAFDLISDVWVRVGWNQKHSYTFSWMGRPIIQLPHDMVRVQEVLHRVRPDVIVETGVAHGGSLVYYASLCRMFGRGRVIGVDIEIRDANRAALEAHELASDITLLEGSSTDEATLARVRELIAPGESVLVILDSDHSYAHVRAELEAYHGLVTPGSYIVATDGLMKDLADTPRGRAEWKEDNPSRAALDFAAEHPEFVPEQPRWPFNESGLARDITHWPDAWLRRV
jgi:cephalosporin hydroxylase